MSESVCVLGSKSHSGCLPIIMMLLNPSLKLTLLSFSLVLYPPLPASTFLSFYLSLSLSLYTLGPSLTLSERSVDHPKRPVPQFLPPAALLVRMALSWLCRSH